MKNIGELLDSLSAKSADSAITPANTFGSTTKGTGTNDNSFGQVIAKISDQQQNGNNTNQANGPNGNSSTTPVINPSASAIAGTNNQTGTSPDASTVLTDATQTTLAVSEKLQGVKPQDIATIEKSFFAMASGLANLLSQAQPLTGSNLNQIQSQLVASSGGQITPAEAAQLVSAVQSFIHNLPQGQNPLDLSKQDQNQLLGQMLQQMLQNQQVLFALASPASIQGTNGKTQTSDTSLGGVQAVSGISQSNTLSNVTLRFVFTDTQITQTQGSGNQTSQLFVDYQNARLSISTQSADSQNLLSANGPGAANLNASVPSQPGLSGTVNFQPIPQDKVNTILNALAQLGAQPTSNLPVTIVNPTSAGQSQQTSDNGQNLQALFKVLLQSGAGQVVLQSFVAQQGNAANVINQPPANLSGNPFAQLVENSNQSIQPVSVQPIENTQSTNNPGINFNADQVIAPAGQLPQNISATSSAVDGAKSFWTSVNFHRINELVLRFTAFIGQSNATVAAQIPDNQGPAQVAIANTPSAITAQVGSSVGPQASPVSIAQLPNGDQQEIVNNVLTPNTIQLQPTPVPNIPVTSTTRVESQNQAILSQSQLADQNSGIESQAQTPTQGSISTNSAQTQAINNFQNFSSAAQFLTTTTPLTQSNISFNASPVVNANTGLTPLATAPNTVAPSAAINPTQGTNVSGTPVVPNSQAVAVPPAVSVINLVQPSSATTAAQNQNVFNQAANPGISAPPVSLAQNLSGSVASVNLFNQGTAQNQSSTTQTPLVANPVQPSGTVSSITPQAVSAVAGLSESEKLQPVSLQDKNSLADQMSSQTQSAFSTNALVYTLGKNGEMQMINPAGNPVPINAQELIRQLSDQVSSKTGDLKAASSISFQLVPENLGRMTIQISLVDQSVTAKILVTNADVRDTLQQHLVDLKTSLSQSGLQIDQLQVQVQGGGASLLAQYYQFQQEGYGSSSSSSGAADSITGNNENEGVLAPFSTRNSLVDLLV